MPKIKGRKDKKQQYRHNALLQDIESSNTIKERYRKTKSDSNENGNSENYIPPSLSKKLLQQVQDQQAEIEDEQVLGNLGLKGEKKKVISLSLGDETFEDDDNIEEIEIPEGESFDPKYDIDPSDAAAMEFFMKPKAQGSINLADLIMNKINEYEASVNASTADDFSKSTLPPKVVEVFTQIGQMLRTYRSGKLPKAIKIVPSLSQWEEVLVLTHPETWSPAAVFALTRVFASNFNEVMAQNFYNYVLLPRIREDIDIHKKLNWHLYMALKKSLYKPKAFYKGILLPICEAGDCTLREAVIIGSIIKKTSIPAIASSVALMKISQMEYTGAHSLFILILLEKKYALPFRVIDSLIEHFLSFMDEKRKLPVLWQQGLLALAQRYKEDITAEHKQKLKELLKRQFHHQITPEIRRELFTTKCRENEIDDDGDTKMRV